MACTFPIFGLKHPSFDATEVVDLTTKKSHIAGSLTTPRQNHGMSVMKIGKTYKLITFGGESMDSDGLSDSIFCFVVGDVISVRYAHDQAKASDFKGMSAIRV